MISKYAKPIEFVSAKQESTQEKTQEKNGDEVASLYKQIVGTSSKETQKKEWCSVCEMSTLDYTSHLSSVAHMVAQTTEAPPDILVLGSSNKGFRMLRSQGWQYEQGLGKEGQGKRHPVATVFKQDRLCLGHKQGPKRVTHVQEITKRPEPKETAKEMTRKVKKESRERVALLHYLKD